jgi:hypothetical protein
MPTAVARAKGALSLAVQIYTRFGKYFFDAGSYVG